MSCNCGCSCQSRCSRHGRSRENEQGLICCHPENPFVPRKRICCDCGGRCCRRFDETSRDCFWPDFTHPTWLCCRIVYGCDPLRCPDERSERHEDERRHDEDEHRGCHCGH